MISEAMDLYRTLDLKSNPMDNRGVHGMDFGFFGPGLRLRPAGAGFRFS